MELLQISLSLFTLSFFQKKKVEISKWMELLQVSLSLFTLSFFQKKKF